MENIIEPNESFDFSKLTLAHPVGIQGGAYFTKIEYNKKSLYIQTVKSLTRQSFIKTGKKYYCDLMFDKNAETLINWFENLEEKCKKLIYEKKDSWFQNSLEETDIDTAFNSTIRIYKSGKYYLVRTNIKNSHNNLPSIKIYDEKQTPLTMEDVTLETEMISILEIQGIKFTSRNFQIEIELKQVMVLENEPLFDNFLIKTQTKKTEDIQQINPNHNTSKNDMINIMSNDASSDKININEQNKSETPFEINLEKYTDDLEEFEPGTVEKIKESLSNDIEPNQQLETHQQLETNNKIDIESLDIEIEDLNKDSDEETNLKEFDIELTLEQSEPIHLKKPNQVYFQLYKDARQKAKQAKKNALIAYLEVKNIKKTYMLDNLSDNSDSDFDAEIDDVSESELEGL